MEIHTMTYQEEIRWMVHATHCCRIHGCKYGSSDCPVEHLLVEQEYPCESCELSGKNPKLIPLCCLKCIYFGSDYSEWHNETYYYCELNVFFPTKKRTCKKQLLKKMFDNDFV